jgi:hypothetical protein
MSACSPKKRAVVAVELTGVSVLLMDRMPEETLDSLITGTPRQLNKSRPLEEMAAEKIYRDKYPNGQIGIPVECLIGALKGAGRLIKSGKKQISTASTTTLFSFLTIREQFLVLLDHEGNPVQEIPADEENPAQRPWTVDKRRGYGEQAGVAVGIVRPRFDEWKLKLTADIDLSRGVDLGTVKRLFEEAGTTQGLCSNRPSCNGPNGRFGVSQWDILEKPEGYAEQTSEPVVKRARKAKVVEPEMAAVGTEGAEVIPNGEAVVAGT